MKIIDVMDPVWEHIYRLSLPFYIIDNERLISSKTEVNLTIVHSDSKMLQIFITDITERAEIQTKYEFYK